MQTCPNCGRESPAEFDFCPACGQPLTRPKPGREVRKTVTVVFCDVTGSTALGERLDPESLRDVQARYFEAMRTAIERHEGTVEKYAGDAVMAVFGIPQLHEDGALRAVRAAADMREGLAALNKELERDRGVKIQVRIGVNTGEVVAGASATDPAIVTGDAVNVAARLEQQASPGEILLGDPTYRLVREAVEAEPVEPLELRGKAERVPAWRLLAIHDVVSPVPRRFDSPMVGRERQLAQLRQAFDAAEGDTACQLFTVLGPAGVGKSRLIQEFVTGLVGRAEILRGRCLPYGEGITYFPVVEAIKQAAGLADFDLPDVVEAKVCSVLEGDEHQELVCRHVSQLMGVAGPTAGEETFWAIRRFFEASARERPLVLVFDDIHWGQPTFLDLVEHVADWSRGSPILLLCMARPELLDVRPSWGGGKKLNAATVSLEPLSQEQSEALIANLLGSAELPPEVAERIVETAEGNPLFVEETLATLVDDELMVRENGRWVAAGDLSHVTVPPSIQALLASRVDRLTPEERTVLEAAAVVGKGFIAGAVRDLVGEDARSRVRGDLMTLVRKELIRPDRSTLPGEDAFRFRHLLIRDAAYEAIPKARRAELHERFADWLERVAGDAIAEQEEIVAYHLEQAHTFRTQLGPPDKRTEAIARRASDHLASAGRRASARGDHVAAANLMRRAVAGGARGADRARILYDLGDALQWVGELQQSFDAFDEAARLASEAGDPSLELMAGLRRSETMMLTDPHAKSTDEFRSELEDAIRVFEEVGDDAALATVWTQLAEIEGMLCRYDGAEIAAGRAIDHARRSGDERLLTSPLLTSISARMSGSTTPEEGIRGLNDLRDDLSRSPLIEALALVARAFHLSMGGRFREARHRIELADAAVQALGLQLWRAFLREVLGYIELYAGDAAAAERAFREDYDILDELGDEGHKSTAAANLALALCAIGSSTRPRPSRRSRSASPPRTTWRRRLPDDRRGRSCSRPGASSSRPSGWRARPWTCMRTRRPRTTRGTSGWTSRRSSGWRASARTPRMRRASRSRCTSARATSRPRRLRAPSSTSSDGKDPTTLRLPDRGDQRSAGGARPGPTG
jgi:class 3 adenylate cyclase/tetratricopeptide (TPR) repeat protein